MGPCRGHRSGWTSTYLEVWERWRRAPRLISTRWAEARWCVVEALNRRLWQALGRAGLSTLNGGPERTITPARSTGRSSARRRAGSGKKNGWWPAKRRQAVHLRLGH